MEGKSIKDIERQVKMCNWRIEVIKGWQKEHPPGTSGYLYYDRMILDEEAELDKWKSILEIRQRAEKRVQNTHGTRTRVSRKRAKNGKGGRYH